jgi:hypothetical protein
MDDSQIKEKKQVPETEIRRLSSQGKRSEFQRPRFEDSQIKENNRVSETPSSREQQSFCDSEINQKTPSIEALAIVGMEFMTQCPHT